MSTRIVTGSFVAVIRTSPRWPYLLGAAVAAAWAGITYAAELGLILLGVGLVLAGLLVAGVRTIRRNLREETVTPWSPSRYRAEVEQPRRPRVGHTTINVIGAGMPPDQVAQLVAELERQAARSRAQIEPGDPFHEA